jgi:hypothetical protein
MTTQDHREAFEVWFEERYGMNFSIGEYRKAQQAWQAAMRYHDELANKLAAAIGDKP